jgi:hypothetical protein
MTVQPIDPRTIHPALRDALLTRDPLLWAYDNDGQMRELTMRMPGVLDVHLDDQGRGVVAPVLLTTSDPELATRQINAAVQDAALAPFGWTRRCPECKAGKHADCTGEALDDRDQLVPCTCTDPADHGVQS